MLSGRTLGEGEELVPAGLMEGHNTSVGGAIERF